MTTLRVYLAGPIRGCSEEQQTWWRKEVKERLNREFEFEDPTDWADDKGIPLEIAKLEACDIVLANMWKESIGTTLGIVRARQQGKPVVLIDPNRISNAILDTLVLPETHVHSIDEACMRVRKLAVEFKPFVVAKKDGEPEDFNPRKLARSVSAAAAAAGRGDPGFEEQISGPVIAKLRREGGQSGTVTTERIRTAVFERLEWMHGDPNLPRDLRTRAADILEAWKQREKVKRGEDTIKEYEERALRAEEDAANWKRLLQDLRGQPVPVPEPEDRAEKSGPRYTTIDQMLRDVTKRWKAFLVFHDEAKATARRIKPGLSPRGLEDLYALLERLGEFAKDRAFAAVADETPPDFSERFGDRYAPTESKETKDRYRKEPLEHGGKKYHGLQHLKMTDERGRKVRVYFDEISTAQFLVCAIGHRETFGYDG